MYIFMVGFGNFEEIGPLDVNQNPRPYSWVKAYVSWIWFTSVLINVIFFTSANLLFVDNPVGKLTSVTSRYSCSDLQ